MFYLVTLAEEQNEKFWVYADSYISGGLDWRLVATAKWPEVIGRFHDFIFDHSFRWNEDPHRDLTNIVCCLWELNPGMTLDELRDTCDDIRVRTGCRCLVVPDEIIQFAGFWEKERLGADQISSRSSILPDLWLEFPYGPRDAR